MSATLLLAGKELKEIMKKLSGGDKESSNEDDEEEEEAGEGEKVDLNAIKDSEG